MRSEASGSSEHFGAYLKRGREARGLSIAELSRATKIKERSLELIEQAQLDALPAPVFVRGFVSAYAREVGLDVREAMRKLSQKLPEIECGKLPQSESKKIVQPAPADDAPESDRSRRVGVAVVVLLILVVATLTLSLLLRHSRAAEGLSSRALLEDHVHV